MTPLEKELEQQLLLVYPRCATIRYYPRYFKRMLTCSNPRFNKGPVGTVSHLLTTASAPPDSGFCRLAKAGKLEWTVEWLIAKNPKFHPLFVAKPWVIKNAEARLRHALKT